MCINLHLDVSNTTDLLGIHDAHYAFPLCTISVPVLSGVRPLSVNMVSELHCDTMVSQFAAITLQPFTQPSHKSYFTFVVMFCCNLPTSRQSNLSCNALNTLT
ncbi:hypothetical protein KP509_27G054100 [Ceratopteris richardii]|uniref:Uncharacterized protein n=1 Tax=Ceratopteris richardii TaxID=49495 RepID=A0A8T2RHY4_CERRI|nr:hypothetical protein KP509_27G054100 [Ceratopteris richardii]